MEREAKKQAAQARMAARRAAWQKGEMVDLEAVGTGDVADASKKVSKKREREEDLAEGEPTERKIKRAKPSCKVCGREGHIRTNKTLCPALNGEWADGKKPIETVETARDANTEEQVEVAADQPAIEVVAESVEEAPKEDAKPQHTRKDSHHSQRAVTVIPEGIEVIDLEVTSWTALLFVNDVQVGTVSGTDGIKLLKRLPTVKGPITSMHGFETGDLSIRRTGKAYLAVGGSVSTDSAIKRGLLWYGVDNYSVKIDRTKACKELRVTVSEGLCVMHRDGVEVFKKHLEVVKARENLDITSDGSLEITPLAEDACFEDWRRYSNDKLARMKHLRLFPALPPCANQCRQEIVVTQFGGVGCRAYKQAGNFHAGAHIGGCTHDIMHFIQSSDAAKAIGWRAVLEMEHMRFQDLPWEQLEDEALRKQIIGVKDEYMRHLELISLWFEQQELEQWR